MPGYPGGDTLIIVTKTPTGATDSMGIAVTSDAEVPVYGCVFEPLERGPVEQMSDTTTSSERAWAFFPYIEGVTTGISNANWIRPLRPDPKARRDYKVQGRLEIEYDLDGQPDHVWVTCEFKAG